MIDMKATPILIALPACICTACGHKPPQPSPATDTVKAVVVVEEAPAKEPVSYTLGTQPAFDDSFSQKQLNAISDELNRRYQKLDDPKLKANLYMWGTGANTIEVYFIQNTPEARQAFKEKLMDSPAIRFKGPEEPVPNAQTYTSDTLGISLRPLRSAYHTADSAATFVLINRSRKKIMCGDHYSVSYEDERGAWRELPINTVFFDVGYLVFPGEYKTFTALLYPHIHPNKPGRYRFFYRVRYNNESKEFMMMTEFRLTADKGEAARAATLPLPGKKDVAKQRDTVNIEYIPTEEESLINCLETRPEFPGGWEEMLAYIQRELRYPEDAWQSGIQGRVRVQVTITKEGRLTEPKVVRSVDPRLDEEAVRVIMSMPRWKPGLMRGKPVEVKYVIPVAFRLKTE